MKTGDTEINTKPRDDESLVEARGHIRIAKLKIGGRRLTHPSGVEVIETVENLAKWRAGIVVGIAEKQADLVAFDADRTM